MVRLPIPAGPSIVAVVAHGVLQCRTLTRAGIRELRQNASALIRRVIAGETIEVTDRGRPVARIVPLRGRSVIDQMVAEGRATETRGELLDLKPIQPVTGRRRLSEVLADLRADER